MNFKKEIAKQIQKHISKQTKLHTIDIEALIEIPPTAEMGDYSFPCFSLSKQLKKNPVNISQDLQKAIKPTKEIELIESKGPYLNFHINKQILVKEILENNNNNSDDKSKKAEKKGKSQQTMMIEFSQANTHKAFHVGHIRGTSLGESLARILESKGNKIIRANYEGDTGMHVAKWIWCYQKYHSKEKPRKDEQWIASIYVDAVKRLTANEKLQEEVNEINKKLDEGKDKELNKLWKETRKLSLDAFEIIYKELNTKFDHYYFEGEVEEQGKKIAQDLVKKGIAEISEGATIVNLEEQKLGVSVILRGDGTILYPGKDLYLAKEKFKEYKLDKSLYIVADEQNLHLKQVFKILELDKFKQSDKLKHVAFGMVRLPHGKMSSRTGDNILYSDFKQELLEIAKKSIKQKWPKLSSKELETRALKITIAAMKYPMLSQDPNKTITFDKTQAMKFEGETGPYIQYTYARATSILKKSNKQPKLTMPKIIDKNILPLIKKLSELTETTQRAATQLNPAIVAHYSYQLSQLFNEFYHNTKVIDNENEQFLLKVIDLFRTTLKTSLNLLGIDVLEEM
jgi:arginyl-tRNA synthetase